MFECFGYYDGGPIEGGKLALDLAQVIAVFAVGDFYCMECSGQECNHWCSILVGRHTDRVAVKVNFQEMLKLVKNAKASS